MSPRLNKAKNKRWCVTARCGASSVPFLPCAVLPNIIEMFFFLNLIFFFFKLDFLPDALRVVDGVLQPRCRCSAIWTCDGISVAGWFGQGNPAFARHEDSGGRRRNVAREHGDVHEEVRRKRLARSVVVPSAVERNDVRPSMHVTQVHKCNFPTPQMRHFRQLRMYVEKVEHAHRKERTMTRYQTRPLLHIDTQNLRKRRRVVVTDALDAELHAVSRFQDADAVLPAVTIT